MKSTPWIEIWPTGRCYPKLPYFGQRCIIYVPNEPMTNPADRVFVSEFVKAYGNANDQVPYAWKGPGPYYFFGQNVSHWMPIPDLPIENV